MIRLSALEIGEIHATAAKALAEERGVVLVPSADPYLQGLVFQGPGAPLGNFEDEAEAWFAFAMQNVLLRPGVSVYVTTEFGDEYLKNVVHDDQTIGLLHVRKRLEIRLHEGQFICYLVMRQSKRGQAATDFFQYPLCLHGEPHMFDTRDDAMRFIANVLIDLQMIKVEQVAESVFHYDIDYSAWS